MKPKTPSASLTIQTDIVLPSETNSLNHLFGGELLSRMDRAASIAARRHCNEIVVTASVNHVSFQKPIPQNSVVSIKAKVSRAFNTSVEVIIDVFVEDPENKMKDQANQGIYTFVAVDNHMKPVAVPPIIPESEEEKIRYDAALRRKELSLILAGKMKPQKAIALKAIFK